MNRYSVGVTEVAHSESAERNAALRACFKPVSDGAGGTRAGVTDSDALPAIEEVLGKPVSRQWACQIRNDLGLNPWRSGTVPAGLAWLPKAVRLLRSGCPALEVASKVGFRGYYVSFYNPFKDHAGLPPSKVQKLSEPAYAALLERVQDLAKGGTSHAATG